MEGLGSGNREKRNAGGKRVKLRMQNLSLNLLRSGKETRFLKGENEKSGLKGKRRNSDYLPIV